MTRKPGEVLFPLQQLLLRCTMSGDWNEWLTGRLAELGEELSDESIIEYIDSIVQMDDEV